GMGWPPGGPWITSRFRSKRISWQAHEIQGPAVWEEKNLPTDSMVMAWKIPRANAEKTVLPESCVSLTSRIRRQDQAGWLRWNVPEGQWLIGVFRVAPGALCDKGNGPEVDPASREAVIFHLEHYFGRLDPKLRKYYGTTLWDVASDSWEYGRGGNRYWSPAILVAFPKSAGYDLRKKMHALLGYGPEKDRVLADLEKVEQTLIRENFFVTAAQFLHDRGLGHRPQAYGRGLARDLLEIYSVSDTPEVEQGIVLPEAPWSAHTSGHPLVSAEAFTFLSRRSQPVKRPHGAQWETSPALLRWHANAFFAEGFNRIQMHAFSYSPPGIPLPGWRIYAETHLNRNVPWWPFLPNLTAWMTRNQWVLQAGGPVADTVVYPVRSNPADGPFQKMGDRQPISAANAIDAANEFTFPNVKKRGGPVPYDFSNICLLEDIKTVKEAAHILDLVESGATLLCCRNLPEQWSALRTAIGGKLLASFEKARGDGRIIDARAAGWKKALDDVRSVRWTPRDAKLVFHHRRVRDGDVYFIVNQGGTFHGKVSFPHAGGLPEMWDADTGNIRPAARYREENGRTRIPLSLNHFESAIMSFSQGQSPSHVVESDGGHFQYMADKRLYGHFEHAGSYHIRLSDGTRRTVRIDLPPPLPIANPWRLSVDGLHAVSPQPPIELMLDRLVSWRQLPELKHYAGIATYATAINIPPELVDSKIGLRLELGQVYELARVWLNDQEVGTAWRPSFVVDVTGRVKAGKNVLRIDVPNVLRNHLEKGDGYDRPSGLLGPVILRPYGRILLQAATTRTER
ncbi:MAG: glycosyl hydrolase, partial [Planctomycetota bacterium]|nr:glycosyl hydrolase [Planctomycetota bacterium]